MNQIHYRADRVRRRIQQLLLLVFVSLQLGCVGMVVGPWLDDLEIDRHPGRALATVTAVSDTRTTVEYQDETGALHSPEGGLLYPSGLGAGQRVWVSYSTNNPDLVKVEGRRWTLAIIPALSTSLVVGVGFGVLWWLSRDRRKAGGRDSGTP